MSETIPRRCRLDTMTVAERAIFTAIQAVEDLPADGRLTDAVVLLQEARTSVGDYVDAVPRRESPLAKANAAVLRSLDRRDVLDAELTELRARCAELVADRDDIVEAIADYVSHLRDDSESAVIAAVAKAIRSRFINPLHHKLRR